LSSSPNLTEQFYDLAPVKRIERWLTAMPHPPLVVDIAATHVAAARWGKINGALDSFYVEPLTLGSVMPSPVEMNVAQPDAVKSALRRVFDHVPAREHGVVLLIPDLVVRVFILPFDALPRNANDALPLLRWRLKKSVPFDVDETVVSWMRQAGNTGNLEVVTAVARQRIIREYEEIVEGLNAKVGVVLSSTLATLPLIEAHGATLMIRMSGKTMTTVIVRGGSLCVYRSTDMASDAALLSPQAMLDEIFPAMAYYQDTWGGAVDWVRLAGFGAREAIFRNALSEELKCSVGSLAESQEVLGLDSSAKDLLKQNLEGLVGWMRNGGS
jgi:type IV pilus assembly protein PilM